MIFSNYRFFFAGVFLPLALLALTMCFAAMLSSKFKKSKNGASFAAIPFIVWGVGWLLCLLSFADGFKYPISILIQHDVEERETIGTISDIHYAPSPPVYYQSSNRTFLPAKLITVNDATYYLIEGDLEVGQYVQLIWSTNERIVRSWRILAPQNPDEIGIGEQFHSTVNKAEIIYDYSSLGKVIGVVSFLVFVLVVAAQFVGGKALSHYLVERDRVFRLAVIPNKIGMLIYLMILLPLVGVMIGWALSGFNGIWLVGLLALVPMLKIVLTKQTTFLTIAEQNLYVKYLGHEQFLPINDISTICWRTSRIPYNRCLVIIFNNGFSLSLEQENFWGLDYLYSELCKK